MMAEVIERNNVLGYVEKLIKNMPIGWLEITTHRLDIYNESRAKEEFLEGLEVLFNENKTGKEDFDKLPTAYDYIRLGHPLSCVLEWSIAKTQKISADYVISFSSQTIAVMAVLRQNLLDNKNTRIIYNGDLPAIFNAEILRDVYGYKFELKSVEDFTELDVFEGSTVFISQFSDIKAFEMKPQIDFYIHNYSNLGSILLVNGEKNSDLIPSIQHVRRRETIAMTPVNSLQALKLLISNVIEGDGANRENNKKSTLKVIKEITQTNSKPVVGSSGLSVQYAIMMGLIHHANETHKGKDIKFIVPPNCYGGTNDQARRVAACIDNVEVLDLPVDGGNDMVESIDTVLTKIADQDALAYIIAEIPTNPRVEVPDLIKLKDVLSKERKTASGNTAVDPVFILDQTFCPNVNFLGEGEVLSTVRTISYASGSKFPSGGLCTAGYCVANAKAENLMDKIAIHLTLCDNEATDLQYELLAKQLPSMNQRIIDAYSNTREFVNYIIDVLPEAKINFVSEELASQGFTPSVFSLDLPTKGSSEEEKETYKRALNLKLINLMITEIPTESKFCVSYGQLKGCYWTIPATSTQGTTKEGDKDYIVRVALSASMDLDLHKKVFLDFVNSI